MAWPNRSGGDMAMRGHQPDYVLALAIFILLAIGMVMMYSMSPVLSHKLLGSAGRNYYFYGQLGNIAAGIVVWVVAAAIPYRRFERWAPMVLALAGVATVLLLVPGLSFTKNGATRWLKLGPASFQPAEVLKLGLVLYLAAWFQRKGDRVKGLWEGLIPFGLIMAGVAFCVAVFQRDLGSVMVLGLTAFGMYLVAGAPWRHFGLLMIGAITAAAASIAAFPHRLARLTTFLNPGHDPTGQGYHISQALIAIGSGGLLGVGLGKSIQVYGYLPEAANDSIFAIIAEEFGLIGSLVIVGLFVTVAIRGLRVARRAPDGFARQVAVGVTLWILLQALINMAAMVGLVPLTGIPLPFISYGGSSLVFTLAGAGILLNISKFTQREAVHEGASERRRYGWSHFAHPGNGRRVKIAR